MQKFKREQYLGGVKSCPVYIKSSRLLNVEHEVATVQVLHHEEEVGLKGDKSQSQRWRKESIWQGLLSVTHSGLKSTEEVTQERVLAAERQDLPLDHGALDVVVLQHDVLLQRLDGVVRRLRRSQTLSHARPQLGQYDLAERSLAQHLEEIEVFHAVFSERRPAAEKMIACYNVDPRNIWNIWNISKISSSQHFSHVALAPNVR